MVRDAAFEDQGRLAVPASAGPEPSPRNSKTRIRHVPGRVFVVSAAPDASKRPRKRSRMNRTTRITRTLAVVALSAALAASLSGCTKSAAEKPATKPAEKAAAAFPVTITDDAGKKITIASKPERIVSLAPADTEILFAVGAGKSVVGVTSYDDYPAEVKDIAKVGDFAGPNVEAVAGAKPDLILATAGVQADVVAKLEALGAKVIVIDPQTLDGVYADIAAVGAVTGNKAKADSVVAGMRSDVEKIKEAVSGETSVTAFVEIGQNPLYTVGSGTLMDELVKLGGGTNVVTESGYVAYSAEKAIANNPAVYLATASSATDAASVAKRPGYSAIDAVKNNRVVILDDNLVSRPGPRVVEGLKLIAAALHPDVFK